MTKSYIKNNLNNIVDFDSFLNPQLYKIGTTWKDFESGCWILLTNSQLNFKKQHPQATIKEIFYEKIDESIQELNLQQLKEQKIQELKNFDASKDIRKIIINNIPGWWDKDTRISIRFRLEIETNKQSPTTTLWLSGQKIEITIKNAQYILNTVEEYAFKCLDNTNQHILNIQNLNTIEEVNKYNFKIGYPELINITI